MSSQQECLQIRPLLDAYYDGEVSPEERIEVEHHLQTCDACKRELQKVGIVAVSVQMLPSLAPKRDFADGIEEWMAKRQEESNAACQQFAPLLDCYYDGEVSELSEIDRTSVKEHVQTCQPCRNALGEIERVVVSLKTLPQIPPKLDIADNFESILKSRRNNIVFFRRRSTWTSVGIAAGVALLALAYNFSSGLSHGVIVGANPAQSTALIATAGQTAVAPVQQTASAKPSSEVGNHSSLKPTEVGKSKHALSEIATHSSKREDANEKHGSSALMVANAARSSAILPKNLFGSVAKNKIASNAVKKPQLPDDGEKIATLPQGGNKPMGDDIIALYDGTPNPAEDIGISTDEDGLYAIKL